MDAYSVGWSPGAPRHPLRTYFAVKNGIELPTRYATLDEVFAFIDAQPRDVSAIYLEVQ